MYLDSYDQYLTCIEAKPFIDFRGRLCRRHVPIPGWSLTGYLKALHSGGMSWEAIYWHVWGACQVFQIDDITISALETDKYSIESDGILIHKK